MGTSPSSGTPPKCDRAVATSPSLWGCIQQRARGVWWLGMGEGFTGRSLKLWCLGWSELPGTNLPLHPLNPGAPQAHLSTPGAQQGSKFCPAPKSVEANGDTRRRGPQIPTPSLWVTSQPLARCAQPPAQEHGEVQQGPPPPLRYPEGFFRGACASRGARKTGVKETWGLETPWATP